MKYAPIVPTAHLPLIKKYDYHLVLAQLCIKDKKYKDFYQKQEGHLILDNGAYEGTSVDYSRLLNVAKEISPVDLTVPDVLGNFIETRKKLSEFVAHLDSSSDEGHRKFRRKLLVVIQAQTWDEFSAMVYEALLYDAAALALPKIMVTSLGHGHARLIAAEKIRDIDETIPIHAFGGTNWHYEAHYLARQGIVRGIDCAMPIVNAITGHDISVSHIKRPDNYFDLTIQDTARVERNMNEYRAWCETAPIGEMRGVRS